MNRIAIIGAKGQLGSQLCVRIGDAAIPLDLPEFDVRDESQVNGLLEDSSITTVINCAAYTAVDQAESEPTLCRQVNTTAVTHLASACTRSNSLLVQISTDYVFGQDRLRRTPYREDDVTGPLAVYGLTKRDGEIEAAKCPRHLIVRTCGLYGLAPRKNNFIETVLRLARERNELQIVDDQHCTPSSVIDVAAALLELIRAGATGIYHVVNGGETTWFHFAQEIFRQSGCSIELVPISSEQFGAKAPRPAYSVLDTSRCQTALGSPLRPWEQALAAYLANRDTSV